jgi:hypothetical protein
VQFNDGACKLLLTPVVLNPVVTLVTTLQGHYNVGTGGRYSHLANSGHYSSAIGRGHASRPDHDQQHFYHHSPTVKPEAATALVELLMMGVRTPETW